MIVAAERPTRTKAGKRAKRSAAPGPETTQPPMPDRQFVDIDPWAVLLEGLMDMPEEVLAERKRPKGK
jgi:hypothetical protein